MTGDKILVKLITDTRENEIITWPLKGIEYVEQLVYDVLDSRGVGPIHRILFGLKICSKDSFWFAPNLPVGDVQDLVKDSPGHQLEIRLRFRPSSFRRILASDRAAFRIIYAQIKHDFMRTKFNDERSEFVLLNDAVLGLIAFDLIRYSIKHKIDIDNILKQVDPKDFIPESASKWQRSLIFRLAEHINLSESLHLGYNKCENDIDRIEYNFIELFLSQVAQDYGSETYSVVRVGLQDKSGPMEIRIRYHQTKEESKCLIESRLKSKSKSKFSNEWDEVCNIETISSGTLRQKTIQIARHHNCPVKFEFQSIWHAQSFISCLDGYYRLMRKWNFNLSREIISPELNELKRICCHGPIGSETSRIKLSQSWRLGRFLIRKCMEIRNRFLIDIILKPNARLIIDVDWDPNRNVYKVGSNAVNKKINITVESEKNEYPTLKSLVAGTQIWIEDDDKSYPQQLKHWLPPSEADDYPALLLSISKQKMQQFVSEDFPGDPANCIDELPRFIPISMLNLSTKELTKDGKQIQVRLATLNRTREVVLKSALDAHKLCPDNQLMFISCSSSDFERKCSSSSCIRKSKLLDWIFMKHNLLAETIGLSYLPNNSLVQEYFPLGPLDVFLHQNAQVSPLLKLSASLQLAEALLFLQERSIIHGKIRCHNIFIEQAHPIKIKLADPLGTFDIVQDQAFTPPEFFGVKGELCIRQYDSAIDVWSFGTTMWQIYADGARPQIRYANMLVQPSACPDNVWNTIESCWILDAKTRPSPRTLLRDLNDSFAWENGIHEYHYIYEISSNSGDNNNNINNNLKGETITATASPQTLPANTNCSGDTSPRSSITSSTASNNYSNNSQAYLLKASGSTSPNSTPANNNNSNNSTLTKKPSRASWKNLVNFKNRPTITTAHGAFQSATNKSNLISRAAGWNFSDLTGSRLNLSGYQTPSGSEVTRVTEVLDFQGISDAFDRCVWHVESSRLKLGPEIGRGTSGVVMKGILSQFDGRDEQIVAVKCLDKNHRDYSLSNVEDLKKEFDILKDLNHKNVIKALGYVEESYMMLIFEYMPLGSLLSFIKNSHHDDFHSLPLLKYAQDIASGMEYLETSMRIVHRDLALRNILVESQTEVKICDFGLARFLGTSDHYKLKTERALPLKWYAPESLIEGVFTHESDVWSYGIVLWEIYSGGNSPQYSGTYANLAQTLKHERLPMPRDCPKEMYELMMKCWQYEPRDRISFSMIGKVLKQFEEEEEELKLLPTTKSSVD